MTQVFATEKLDRFINLTYNSLNLSQEGLSALRTLHAMYGAFIPAWQLKTHSLMNIKVSLEVRMAYREVENRRYAEKILDG